ncbi:MAG: HRDC domain-containing protein [Bacteroidia bacterium]|nr:HRDC domain-containing protein [Bacteroidota bacterium]MBP6640114.1 HRDC domain-containing protein [Bacteroidia bacterium]MBP6721953.1 HRDC domain-containing protein [Bacteroidia bacterium]
MESKVGSFELVEDAAALEKVIDHLKGFSLLAVDFEGEWNLHRYGLHLCLIQVSDGENIFLIDPVKVGDLDAFLKIMEDPAIEIISHGPQSDIVLMDYLYGRQPRNVFDTEKAAQLLGYENTSLSFLLERHFGIIKNTKVRVSDWNQRPLTETMLNYASKDVEYLHRLKDILTAELQEKGRREWLSEECKELEDIRYKKKDNPHLEIQGASKLNERQAFVLKFIYELRDQIAKDLDKPAYYIIPNSKLIDLALDPPPTEADWCEIKGVNPRIKKYAHDFFHGVAQAQAAELHRDSNNYNDRNFKGLSKTAYFKLVDEKTALLEQIRDQIKVEYDIYPMILSMRNLKRVAYGEATLNDLKEWQKEILLDKAHQMELDVSILMS